MSRAQLEASSRRWAGTLVGWMSVTGSDGEVEFPRSLAVKLRSDGYFRDHPADVHLLPIPGDGAGKSSLLALVRGSGRRAIVLTGHFDVVAIDNYGDLAPLASSPAELSRRLIARLAESGGNPLALSDLKSGQFLPGRGMLDMKSGLAAGLAVLEAFAADPHRHGNLLFLAVPDEENQSAGMRAAAPELVRFAAANDLDLALAINLDAICDNGDGRKGQLIAQGTIGKLLLGALVVGKEAHACYPLDGINSSYLAAALVTEFEFAPELSEETDDELAVPPTVLGSRDLKPGYDVTIPGRDWVFWNVITHRRSAAEVIEVATGLARRALGRARRRMDERRAKLKSLVEMTPAWEEIDVVSFAEVYRAAASRSAGFEPRIKEKAAELASRDDIDYPTRSRRLAEMVWDASGRSGPAVMFLFASMPYPSKRLAEDDAGRKLSAVLEGAARRVSGEFGTPITLSRYFPAISDMSFIGRPDIADLDFISRNAPLWGSSILWDAEMPAADTPVINVGPCGRDYHHPLERTNVRYTFTVLPALLTAISTAVLGGDHQPARA